MKTKVGKTQRRIKVTSKKERKIDPEDVAKALDAEICKEVPDVVRATPQRS